jgi:RNA polymerase sigma factor (sigma-70 family)
MPATTASGLRDGTRPDEDAWLARRAAAGDGAAFGALYDRYERRAYRVCHRITGSRDDAADATQETFVRVLERLPSLADRELDFAAYLLAAARNASYDAIARRRSAAPAAEIPDSAIPVGSAGSEHDRPEHRALLGAHQEQIRAANDSLPPRQREVLALRELEELSYDQIAAIMGMNRNSVAQLLSRARIGLRDGLRRTALASIAADSPDCERALPLLSMRRDGVLDSDAASWLHQHLRGCATCRARLAAMEEAGVAYRLWLPLVPALWLRGEAIARAAERVGSEWSDVERGSRRWRRRSAAGGSILVALVAAALVLADGVQAPGTAAPAATTAAEPAAALVRARPAPKRSDAPRSGDADGPRAQRPEGVPRAQADDAPEPVPPDDDRAAPDPRDHVRPSVDPPADAPPPPAPPDDLPPAVGPPEDVLPTPDTPDGDPPGPESCGGAMFVGSTCPEQPCAADGSAVPVRTCPGFPCPAGGSAPTPSACPPPPPDRLRANPASEPASGSASVPTVSRARVVPGLAGPVAAGR